MCKRIISLLMAVVLLVCCAAMAEEAVSYDAIYSASNPIPEIARNVRPSIVMVVSSVESWDSATRVASVDDICSGSGSYIIAGETEGGYILTNYHIVQDCDVFRIEWLSGETMDADLVGYDDGTDIAVLRFSEAAPEGANPIPLGDSDALQIGELAICIGNPGSSTSTLFGTVTAGIISGLDREDINANNFSRSISVIQTDAAINVGNSGGALLNAKGELVGIPTLKLMYSTDVVYEGLGFCIPINTIKGFIDQIIDSGSVTRPRMGMSVSNFDGPEEPMKKYPPIGAQVQIVEANSPADKAGIKLYDIITEVNGNRIYGYADVLKEIDKLDAGDSVELKVYRYYDENGELTGSYEELYFEIVLEMID